MRVETFPLDRFNEVRSGIETAITERRSIFIEVPGEELPRILEAIELDRDMPRGVVGRLKALLRIPRLAQGLVGNFFVIYLLAKKHGMAARTESFDGKRGILFKPR